MAQGGKTGKTSKPNANLKPKKNITKKGKRVIPAKSTSKRETQTFKKVCMNSAIMFTLRNELPHIQRISRKRWRKK
jgi:hypothetical protein